MNAASPPKPAHKQATARRENPGACALDGCNTSLAGMRSTALYCCDSHGGMARRGERLKAPGACAYCGAPLGSARQRYHSKTCRNRAYEERTAARLGHLLRVLPTRDAVSGATHRRRNGTAQAPGDRGAVLGVAA